MKTESEFITNEKPQAGPSRIAVREHWGGVLKQWAESGKSKAAFCRDEGIAQSKFYYWFRRLNGNEGGSRAGFVRVEPRSQAGILLRLPSGLEIEVDADCEDEILRRLFKVAGSAC